MAKKETSFDSSPVLAENRKAYHNYTILSRYEAGVQLVGTEVKSCRARQIALADAFVNLERGQAFLENAHIAVYDHGNRFNHAPKQKRRLLLHKKEILKLSQQVREKGLTVVPLKFLRKGGLIKVEIALAKGKTYGDKREVLKARQDEMDARRAMRNHS